MAQRKVLYICHNHPSVRPGGAEVYALELYAAMRRAGDFEPFLLAKGGPPMSPTGRPHSGTQFGPIDGDPNQALLYTDGYQYDSLFGTMRGKEFYTRHFREFLEAVRPDVVHFQHTLFLGYDLLQEVRNTLPYAPIVYTLHEYLPICHRQGQMVRGPNNDLCLEESPRRCHECFPDVSPQDFFLRKRFIQSHLSLVDLFLAPSRFLLERYADWGVPLAKLRFEEYGRLPSPPALTSEEDRPRNRFGYFGQLVPFKGVHVLLRAMHLLGREASSPRARLWVHGANLDLQPGDYQNEFTALLEGVKDSVTVVGRYSHAELPRLMARIDWVVVPSLWSENSPLVIQEAFQHGKPVLCSDVGGMAEKVIDRVSGLHFRVGDPASLAEMMRRAATSPSLWEQLRRGIPSVYGMGDHVAALTEIYSTLLERTAARR
jgi:glycosyltransferase involved in cell wall biosynthesis